MKFKLTLGHSPIQKWLPLMMIRVFIFFLCTTAFGLSTEKSLAQKKIMIDADRVVSVEEVFDIIKIQTDYRFIYPQDLFKDVPKVHLKKGKTTVEKLLKNTLPGNSFDIILTTPNKITIRARKIIIEVQVIITGIVADVNNNPLPGVTVMIKDTQRGTLTDKDGAFTITASPEDTLVISYMGFETAELPVGSETTFSVVLREDLTSLGEVTLNAGYYTVSERERTGNIVSISSDKMERQPVNNPLAAMQGHLSGVNITQTAGTPGGTYDIEIRGRNFISGNTQPLFVIDGVPYDGGSLEHPIFGNSINFGGVSPLNAIDPSTIERIEVLKDADATAIYGSRGANGVVLITTKKGKAEGLQVKVNLSSSLSKVTHFMDLMNTEQYIEVRREAVAYQGLNPLDPPATYGWRDLTTWDTNRYTDWQKELIGGTAHRNNAKINLSAGNEQTRFFLGGSLMSESTVFPGDSKYKKKAVFSNLNHRSKDNKFYTDFSFNYTQDNNNLPRWDLTSDAYTLPPNAPELYDEEGNINWENETFDNPIGHLLEKYNAKTSNLLLNTSLSYKIIPELELRANMGYTKYQLNSYVIYPSTARNPSFSFTPQSYSSITKNTAQRDSWIIEPQVNWERTFGKNKFNVLAGSTFQSQTMDRLAVEGEGFPDNSLIYNIAAANIITIEAMANSQYKYQAVYGRINWNHDEKYILNLTGRRDGSSRFGPGKRFGNFGAVGAAWLFTNEKIFENIRLIDFGKLRGSYGVTGSDNIGDYQYLSTYNITGKDYNGTTILTPSGVFNPNFGWESNKKLELALELELFNRHVHLNTSWFRNRSSNQLIGIPLAATTGFSSLTGNFDATVQNTGWEFDLNTLNLKTGNFRWTSTLNLTLPKNKLISFPGLESSTFANRYFIGKPLSIQRFYHALGVNPETGIYEFEDYNGDGEIKSTDDRQWLRDLTPKFYGGFGNTFTYKDLTLNLFFQFKKQLGLNPKGSRPNPGFSTNGHVELLKRWQKPGDMAEVMRSSFVEGALNQALSNYQSSSGAISDASFIRLRNVDLSYRLPSKWVGKSIDALVYIQGQNLWTITPYKGPDPENPNFSFLPPLRQISLGLELTF